MAINVKWNGGSVKELGAKKHDAKRLANLATTKKS